MWSVKPEFEAAQLAPPLMLLKTPPSELPTKTTLGFEGSIARQSSVELVRPELMATQESPRFVLLAMPPSPTRTTPAVVGKFTELVEPVRETSPEIARSIPKPASSPLPPR